MNRTEKAYLAAAMLSAMFYIIEGDWWYLSQLIFCLVMFVLYREKKDA